MGAVVYIECDNCSAGFELELPPAAFELGRNLKFRCTSCGHSFLVVEGGAVVDSVVLAGPERAEREPPSVTTVEEDGATAAPLPPGSPAPRPMEHVLLRQEGTAYNVPDLATLQRWVVERRVGPDDELDFGDREWVRAIDHAELQPFFEIVEQAESASESVEPVAPAPASPEAAALPEAAPELPAVSDPPEPASSPEDGSAGAAALPEPEGLEDDDEVAATEEAEHWPEAAPPADSAATEALAAEAPAAEDEPPSPPPQDPRPEASAAAGEEPLLGGERSAAEAAPGEDDAALDGGGEPLIPQTEPRTAAAILDGPEDSSSEPSSEDFTFPAAPGQRDGWEIIEPGSLPARPAATSIGVPGEAPVVDATAPESSLWGGEAGVGGAAADEKIDWFGTGVKLGVPKRNPEDGQPAAAAEAAADLTDEATEEWFSGSVAPVDGPSAPPNLAATADAQEEVVPDEPEAAGDRMLGVVAVVAVLAAIAILVWVIRDGGPASTTGAVPESSQPVEVAPPVVPVAPAPVPAAEEPPAQPTTAPATAPTPAAPAEPPAAEEPAAPEPPPKARTTPPPPPDSRSTRARGAEAITRQGWSDVDRKRFSSAKRNFEKAIAAQNNHGPAHFGLGYVLERMGDQPGALDAYCKAQLFAGSDKELRREIRGRLNAIKGSCP
jgi:hypothetical protein